MYVDFARECQYKIGFLPMDTKMFCSSVKYRECPFYRTIKNIGHHCKYLEQCPAYEHFDSAHFDDFVSLANKYCLCEKTNPECKRYKIRQGGKVPPADLLPDGAYYKK